MQSSFDECFLKYNNNLMIVHLSVNLQEDQHISDAESVISTSSRRRSYLQPSQATGNH